MALHILKLCVGAESIEDLRVWQRERMEHAKATGRTPGLWHRTRMFPKRRDEVLMGGSMYWVIKGAVQVRQPIADLVAVDCDDGIARCDIVLAAQLVTVRPVPKRPFQGWRYLPADEAPPDLRKGEHGLLAMPEKMRRQLLELGLV